VSQVEPKWTAAEDAADAEAAAVLAASLMLRLCDTGVFSGDTRLKGALGDRRFASSLALLPASPSSREAPATVLAFCSSSSREAPAGVAACASRRMGMRLTAAEPMDEAEADLSSDRR